MIALNPEERVALITGGTAGIGKATAERLARDGYTVVIVGRNTERGNAAVRAIAERAAHQRVAYLQVDMSLMRDVQQLAERFQHSYSRLDLLIHSAGAIHTQRIMTEEGLEATFTTDYLSRFLLTNSLLDLLKASQPSRIINLAASRSGAGSINFDDLLGERRIGGMRGLGQAQYANDVFTIELARRLRGTGVTANVMHPGAVDTDIRREFPKLVNLVLGAAFKPFALTPEQGAEAPHYLATSNAVADINGGLFRRKQPIQPSAKTVDPALGKRLWDVSQQLIDEALRQQVSV